MKKDKNDIRITVNLIQCGCPDKVTSDMGFLNEMSIVFNIAAECMTHCGCPALAERYKSRSDQIRDILKSRGFYDDL